MPNQFPLGSPATAFINAPSGDTTGVADSATWNTAISAAAAGAILDGRGQTYTVTLAALVDAPTFRVAVVLRSGIQIQNANFKLAQQQGLGGNTNYMVANANAATGGDKNMGILNVNIDGQAAVQPVTVGSTTITGVNTINQTASTVNVAATASFRTQGQFYVTVSSVMYLISYTGKTSTTFTGCTVANVLGWTAPTVVTAGGEAVADNGFHCHGVGMLRAKDSIVLDTTAKNCRGTNANGAATEMFHFDDFRCSDVTYLGCIATADDTKIIADGAWSSGSAANFTSAALPGAAIDVGSTVYGMGWPAGAKVASVAAGTYTVNVARSAATCTIAAASNGAVLPQATINVSSTVGFEAAGTFTVQSQTVTYTGITPTTFTGCSGGTATLATGNVCTQASSTGMSLGVGKTSTGFSGNYSSNLRYTACKANQQAAGQGFTSYLCSNVIRTDCQAQANSGKGINDEYGTDVTNVACISGGDITSGAGAGDPYPASKQLGNRSGGFVCTGSARVSYTSCSARRNGTLSINGSEGGLVVVVGSGQGALNTPVRIRWNGGYLVDNIKNVTSSGMTDAREIVISADTVVENPVVVNGDFDMIGVGGFMRGSGPLGNRTPAVPSTGTALVNPLPFPVEVRFSLYPNGATAKAAVTDTVQTASGVIGSSAGTTVIVATGANFTSGAYILIRNEIMQISSIATNTLTVTRGSGQNLAAIANIVVGDLVTQGVMVTTKGRAPDSNSQSYLNPASLPVEAGGTITCAYPTNFTPIWYWERR